MPDTVDINVHHITRVEGHGNIVLKASDGAIQKVEWQVPEAPRFFEALLPQAKMGQEGEEIRAVRLLHQRLAGQPLRLILLAQLAQEPRLHQRRFHHPAGLGLKRLRHGLQVLARACDREFWEGGRSGLRGQDRAQRKKGQPMTGMPARTAPGCGRRGPRFQVGHAHARSVPLLGCCVEFLFRPGPCNPTTRLPLSGGLINLEIKKSRTGNKGFC